MGRGHLVDRGVERAWGGGDVADRCLVVALVVGFGTVVDCGLERAWGGGDVANRCLMVALVAGFGTVVGCGLGMRFVSWWWVYRRGTWAFGRSWC